MISLTRHSDAKREASESLELPEVKKPRLNADNAIGIVGMADRSIAKSDEQEQLSNTERTNSQAKSSTSASPFKENPYTYLSPDNPDVKSCL